MPSASTEYLQLRAGPLQMILETGTGFLRYLRLGEREIVRGIYGAVRDRDWGTVAPKITEFQVDSRQTAFQVTFKARCHAPDLKFVWRGEITGVPEGTIRFVFDGRAEGPCLKNRIGLCVLHPIAECAGVPCRVHHVDGSITEGEFPRRISPTQPFKNLGVIRHQVAPELDCLLCFEGETFEMEDQRNWTDASFKTYSTPLELPFPVRLEPGARVYQAVTVSLHATGGGLSASAQFPAVKTSRSRAEVEVDWANGLARPGIGFGLAWPYSTLAEAGRRRLASLRPDHLRVDINVEEEGWLSRLPDSAAFASAIGCPLHYSLRFPEEAAGPLKGLAATAASSPAALYLLHQAGHETTPTELVRLARKALVKPDGTPRVAAGTDAYFAELNRQPPPADLDALTCFSFNPQVHSSDELSMIETLEAQRALVESARAIRPQRVVISPITLRPRFNPYATGPVARSSPESDPRQTSPFCALWTLGTLSRLLPCPGIHTLTFYETHGPRGIMTKAGRLYPVGGVFQAIAEFDFVCESLSPRPRDVVVLALRTQAGDARLLAGAFTAQRIRVGLPHWAGRYRLRRLGIRGAGAAGTVRRNLLELDLPAGDLVVIDLEAD